MFEAAHALKTAFAKKRGALLEGLNLHDFITTPDITVTREPYPHIVVDNFFKPEFYARLESFFKDRLTRGLAKDNDMRRFRPFLDAQGNTKEHDGHLYIPQKEDDPLVSFFLSLSWNLFLSELFHQPTDLATTLTMHHHPPGDRTGNVHNDYWVKKFPLSRRLDNGVIYQENDNADEEDPGIYTTVRVIAAILYVGEAKNDDSGGTGLYSQKGGEPHTIVAPRGNRLLAFQISPASFHTFQHNEHERNSFIQWFHMNPSWCKKQYGFIKPLYT